VTRVVRKETRGRKKRAPRARLAVAHTQTRAEASAEKRAHILDAALTEFAEVGYERASTNSIAARAGVAKGLVFHHFGSKDDLFGAVADDVVKLFTQRFEEFVADAPPDLFARVLAWTDVKLAIAREDPRRLRFFVGALVNAPDEVKQKTRAQGEAIASRLMPRLLAGVDFGSLRQGVRPQEALEAFLVLGSGLERFIVPLLSGTPTDEALALVASKAKRMLELLRDGLYGR
jgi:TetR/AcrR family transcriptional regulator